MWGGAEGNIARSSVSVIKLLKFHNFRLRAECQVYHGQIMIILKELPTGISEPKLNHRQKFVGGYKIKVIKNAMTISISSSQP